MTGLLSAISGQFTKAWTLGALFPAAVFVVLYLVFVAPLLPPEFTLAAPHVFGTEWNALSVTFATLVLAGVLYNLDTALIKLYEGYPWKTSILGRWKTRMKKNRLAALRRRAGLLFVLAINPDRTRGGEVDDARGLTLRTLDEEFPDRDDLVLPTRLGNIMRAFEGYPARQYQLDAIYFWPRLIAVIPEPYAATLGDARTSFVFLLTLSFLNTVLGVMTVAAGLRYLPPHPVKAVLAPAILFFVAGGWLYRESFGAAKDWGQLVKGAFDLYRHDLLAKLGYQQKPRTRAEERALWSAISLQVAFGDQQHLRDTSAPGAFTPYVEYVNAPSPATAARVQPVDAQVDPADARVQLSRGVKDSGWLGTQEVVVEAKNTGHHDATVVVTETLPEGFSYRWSSARVNGDPAVVTGMGPYHFEVGTLKAGASALLTYTVCRTRPVQGS